MNDNVAHNDNAVILTTANSFTLNHNHNVITVINLDHLQSLN